MWGPECACRSRDGEVDRVAPALDQAQRARSRLDRAVAAAAVLMPDVPVHEEAPLLHGDLLSVLGMLAHLLEHALAGRTLPLVVGEPMMNLARGQLRLRRGAVSALRP